MSYDPEQVAAYFDTDPSLEWDRLGGAVNGRIRHAIHQRYVDYALDSIEVENPRTLDVGAGPARFAIDLMHRGVRVTVSDISVGQLDLARARIESAGVTELVEAIEERSVLDLSGYDDAEFDLVLCLGGPISYVRHEHPRALRELLRVTRSRLVLSVMSLFGALRLVGPLDAADVIRDVDRHLSTEAVYRGDGVVYTEPSPEWHLPLALFTSNGLRSAIEEAGGRVLAMASANPLVPEFLPIPQFERSGEAEAELTRMEVAASGMPGLLDAGEHIIAVVEPA